MQNKDMRAEISMSFSPRGIIITLCMYYIMPILLLIIGRDHPFLLLW